MKKKYLNNLTKLANFLEDEVKDSQFNIRRYVFHDGYTVEVNEEVPECGTVGCAIGWATQLWNKEAKNSRTYVGFSIRVFGVSIIDDGTYMFDSAWADTTQESKKETIKRIRSFVENGGSIPKSGYKLMDKYNIS